jgi:hypothetical protein
MGDIFVGYYDGNGLADQQHRRLLGVAATVEAATQDGWEGLLKTPAGGCQS